MKIPVIIREKIYIPRFAELKDFITFLREKFTYSNPDWHKAKKQNRWTGNIYPTIPTWTNIIHEVYGPCLALPRGGTGRLRQYAKDFDIDISWVDNRISLTPIKGLTNDIELWPEQMEMAQKMFKMENCLIRSPTGSGKTELLLKLAEWMLKEAGPVLIVVWEGSPKSGLMKQWIDRICKRFDITPKDVGVIGGGKRIVKPLTVAMQQTLVHDGRKWTESFGGIICDEIQRFAAPTFQKVIDIYPCRYRFGASADETRNDGKQFLIYDVFGKIAGEIERADLINQKKIHQVTIRIVPTRFNHGVWIDDNQQITLAGKNSKTFVPWTDLPSEEKNFNELLDAICYNEEREDWIWQFVEPSIKSGHICILATHRVEHARAWNKRIRQYGYPCGLMLGGQDNAVEFETTAVSLRKRTLNVAVGTIQKIATGHDIPSLDRGFVLTPLAGNRQMFEQLTGRFRRTEKDKTDAVMYYFWDQLIYSSHKNRLRNLYPGATQLYDNGEFVRI